jgi:hypothetical protein
MLHKDYYLKNSVENKSLVVGLKGLPPRRTDWRLTASRKITQSQLTRSQSSALESQPAKIHYQETASENLAQDLPLLRTVAQQRLVKADIEDFILCAVVTATIRVCKRMILL